MGERESREVLGRVRREDSERWKQMESWGAGEWNDGFGFCELENWGNSCSFLEAYSSSLEMIRLPLPFFFKSSAAHKGHQATLKRRGGCCT